MFTEQKKYVPDVKALGRASFVFLFFFFLSFFVQMTEELVHKVFFSFYFFLFFFFRQQQRCSLSWQVTLFQCLENIEQFMTRAVFLSLFNWQTRQNKLYSM